jgi:hypothetical protein
MAKQKNTDDEATPGRIAQIRMVAGLVHKANPRALPIVIGSGLAVLVVLVVVGLLIGQGALLIPLGVLGGILLSVFLFGRFAQTSQYSAIEGQPGAAAAVLQSMRGGWTVTPAIAANRNMDVVHRAVGKPGVVLVGEGSPRGVTSLLTAEKKRVARVAFDVPVFDFQVGDAEGQLPLRQLQKKIMKLPRDLKGPQVADLNYRLKALPQTLQAPKGPVPRNARQPKMPKPRAR